MLRVRVWRRLTVAGLGLIGALSLLVIGAAEAGAEELASFAARLDGTLSPDPVSSKGGVLLDGPLVLHSFGSQASEYPNGFKTVPGPFSGFPYDLVVFALAAHRTFPNTLIIDFEIRNGTTGESITGSSGITILDVPLDPAPESAPPEDHCPDLFDVFVLEFQITLAPPVNEVVVGPGDDLQLVITPTFQSTVFDICVDWNGFFTMIGLVVEPIPPPIELSPTTDLNEPGQSHTVTATVLTEDGDPIEGAAVTFEVLSGPSAGASGACSNPGCLTDVSGMVSFTYTGTGGPGVDEIVGSVELDGETFESLPVLKFWDADCNLNDVADTCDIDCAGLGGRCNEAPSCGTSDDANGDGEPDECNLPPICDANGPYTAECAMDVVLDGTGSSDPDGDPLTFAWTGPFLGGSASGPTPTVQFPATGLQSVDLEVNDSLATDTCSATVIVQDTTPPVVSCNAPGTIKPPDAPIWFTATATDACQGDIPAEVTGFDCTFINGAGKQVDKTESCVVTVEGDTVTILDSGGVGDHISWTVRAVDDSGNQRILECEVDVVNPGRGRR